MSQRENMALRFIQRNPGCKNASIGSHLGLRSSCRDLDKLLQGLRRGGFIAYRKGTGWVATDEPPQPEDACNDPCGMLADGDPGEP